VRVDHDDGVRVEALCLALQLVGDDMTHQG